MPAKRKSHPSQKTRDDRRWPGLARVHGASVVSSSDLLRYLIAVKRKKTGTDTTTPKA